MNNRRQDDYVGKNEFLELTESVQALVTSHKELEIATEKKLLEIRAITQKTESLEREFVLYKKVYGAALTLFIALGVVNIAIDQNPLTEEQLTNIKKFPWKQETALIEKVDRHSKLHMDILVERIADSIRRISFTALSDADKLLISSAVQDFNKSHELIQTDDYEIQKAIVDSLELLSLKDDAEGAIHKLSKLETGGSLPPRETVLMQSLMGAALSSIGERAKAEKYYRLATGNPYQFGFAYNGLAIQLSKHAFVLVDSEGELALRLMQEAIRHFRSAYDQDQTSKAYFKYLNNTNYAKIKILNWYLQEKVSESDLLEETRVGSIDELIKNLEAGLEQAISVSPGSPTGYTTAAEGLSVIANYQTRIGSLANNDIDEKITIATSYLTKAIDQGLFNRKTKEAAIEEIIKNQELHFMSEKHNRQKIVLEKIEHYFLTKR